MAVSPNCDLVVSADAAGDVRLAHISGAHAVKGDRWLPHLARLIFNPTSTVLTAITTTGYAIEWSVSPWERLGAPLLVANGSVTAAAPSPDGQYIAVGTPNGAIVLWSYFSRWHIGLPATLGRGPLRDAVFSPNGTKLLSGFRDGSVVEWEVGPTAWTSEACAIAGADLTPGQWDQFVGTALQQRPLCPAARRGSGLAGAGG